jgi:hypothetical protein
MKEKVLIAAYIGSAIISLAYFILSFISVPHIFGMILSMSMLIVNCVSLLYILKIKKSYEQDYKVQYEMMGKKKDDSCLTKSLLAMLSFSYVSINILMVILIVVRIMNISVDLDLIMLKEFPIMCEEFKGESCKRMVLVKHSCQGVDTLVDKYTLIYNTYQPRNTTIAFYVNYCA